MDKTSPLSTPPPEDNTKEVVCFLGCSRGLGRAVALEYTTQRPLGKCVLVARNQDSLNSLASQIPGTHEVFPFDLSSEKKLPRLTGALEFHEVEKIFYFAAGGPHGPFESKSWASHIWSLQVSFLTPTWLLHHFCRHPSPLKQFVVVGSAISESQPNPLSASYTSAKHALKGLIGSLQGEKKEGQGGFLDLRIFSPGYIDTDLIPPKAPIRQNPENLWNKEALASLFVQWVLDPKGSPVLRAKTPPRSGGG